MNAALSQLEREAMRICERIKKLEEIPVPSAAKLLRKTPQWVRDNFPLIIHNKRTHGVRLVDIEAYQARRTLLPKGEFGNKAA